MSNTRADVLARYGVIDRPALIVEPLKPNIWQVRISAEGDPVTCLRSDQAVALANELSAIGEHKLAGDIVFAAEKAHRYSVTGP